MPDQTDASDALIVGVVRGPDGEPAAGATVCADAYFLPMGDWDMGSVDAMFPTQDEDENWSWSAAPERHRPEPHKTTTDARGRFRFGADDELRTALREKRVKVWAEHGELVAPKVILRADAYPARIAPLDLGPSLQPSVRLTDGAGRPVVDAFVGLDLHVDSDPEDRSGESHYNLGARSNEDGIAVLPRIPDRPDWWAWLRVNPKGMPQYLDMDFDAEKVHSPHPVGVVLPSGCTVRGRVELPDGSPGIGVSVSARHDPDDPNPGGANVTTCAADGSFELRGVPTAAVLTFVELRPPDPSVGFFFGDAGGARLTRRVTGAEGGSVDLGVVELPAALSIAGVVLDATGQPAANGHVMLDGIGFSRSIGPDGSFVIDGVEPGRHSVCATIYDEEPGIDDHPLAGSLEATVEDVAAGAQDVVIRVTGGGNLVVRFHPLGKPGERLVVWDPSLCWGH